LFVSTDKPIIIGNKPGLYQSTRLLQLYTKPNYGRVQACSPKDLAVQTDPKASAIQATERMITSERVSEQRGKNTPKNCIKKEKTPKKAGETE